MANKNRDKIKSMWDKGLLTRPDSKKCPKCLNTFPSKEFTETNYNKCGLYSYCKKCEYDKVFEFNSSKSGHLSMLLRSARVRSSRSGLEFNITEDDLFIPDLCPVFGTKLFRNKKFMNPKNSPSLDRIDNTKGYIKGNVVIVSLKANTMKSNATTEELGMLYKFYLSLENK